VHPLRLKVLLVAAVILAVVGLPAVVMLTALPRGATAKEAVRKPVEELTPHTSHALLDLPPTELMWLTKPGMAHWHLDAPLHQLWVFNDDGDRGLLKVGEAGRGGYTISTKLHQTPWTGGIGIFFGYHETVHDGRPAAQFQYLRLTAPEAKDLDRRLSARRGLMIYPHRSDGVVGSIHYQYDTARLPEARTPYPPLELVVSARGLVRVVWDEHHGLDLLEPKGLVVPEKADYYGAFGVMCCQGSGAFRDFEVSPFPDE
jgi:hypothetical protein